MNDNQLFAFGVFAFGSVLFLADAIWNWGMFQNKPRNRRYEKYGPIQRVLRIIIGVVMMSIVVLMSIAMLLDAVPGAGISRAPRPAPPRPQAQVLPVAPAPAAVAPVAAVPATASVRRDDDMRFWLYEDKKGATHMVDALEKVPSEFRGGAREMR